MLEKTVGTRQGAQYINGELGGGDGVDRHCFTERAIVFVNATVLNIAFFEFSGNLCRERTLWS